MAQQQSNPLPTLISLAQTILNHSATLQDKLAAQNIPSPTLHDTTAPNFNDLDAVAASGLLQACKELETIVLGPTQALSLLLFSPHDVSSLGVLTRFDVPKIVPLHGSISFKDLADKTGILEDKLTRILRYTFTNNIFRESPPGHVAHTTLSAHLNQHPSIHTMARLVTNDLHPVMAALPESVARWPQSASHLETAANVATGRDGDFFAWLKEDPGRWARFNEGMVGYSSSASEARPQKVDEEAFRWGALAEGAVVVDVGGGNGHVAQSLAAAHPHLKFIVQDQPGVVSAAQAALPSDAPKNLSFAPHDFFTPQPVHGADVYFFRHIIHDFPDPRAVAILQALEPALKPGARVLISEYVLPEEGGVDWVGEKMVRQVDLQMMCCFNAKERTAKDFEALFTKALPALKFVGKHEVPEYKKGCILEAVYEP